MTTNPEAGMRLADCPFCGGPARECHNGDVPTGMYWVLCDKCHACPGDRNTREAAIDAWNTRALISPAGEVGKPLLGRYIAFNPSNEEGNAVLYPERPVEGCYWTLIGSGPDHDQNRLAAEMVERLNAPRGMEG